MYHQIKKRLFELPTMWDGRNAICEMKYANYPHWRQMEWIGFYFQFLCELKLKDIFEFQQPTYGRIAFDGFNQHPFDFKAHATNSHSTLVIINDKWAINEAIKQYNKIGLILAMGPVEYDDEDRTFQIWHEELKGGPSKYTKGRIDRNGRSRRRKTNFRLEEVRIYEIDRCSFKQGREFQQNFRNSNGRPRNKKLMIDLKEIREIDKLVFA